MLADLEESLGTLESTKAVYERMIELKVQNNHQPSILNPQSSTLNPQPSAFNPQPSTLVPDHHLISPHAEPFTLNLKL